jgi:hypothetical protein
MARSISVKVPTALLIAQVEDKIASIKSAIADYPAQVKQFEADYADYKKTLVSSAIKALTENPELVGEEHDKAIRVSINSHSNSVSVQFDRDALGFPQQPEKPSNPNEREYIGREWTTRLEMLEKNLKILRMTAQEEVNASTYGAIMDLL